MLLFAGQGAQKVGMGKDLADAFPSVRTLIDRADSVLGFPLSQVMFEGPIEELTKTSRCQPALFVHGLAVLTALRERLPSLDIAACAGLSLGEFTAHAAAGTFDFETGLRLVHQRGTFMEEACEQTRGSMAAMIGGDEGAVRELANECGVDVANFNAPGQIVLSGSVEGIKAAVAGAKAKGIMKAVELTVAGAYHSRLMKTAQDKLAAVLKAAYRSDWAPEFMASLPIVGVDGGMENRMRNSPAAGHARIKTGTLWNVSAVAGFVPDAANQVCIVVVMINHPLAAGTVARPILDALLDWVARADGA